MSDYKATVVYSNSLGEMVYKKFKDKRGHVCVWNDSDCVYYDETAGDESYYMEIPEEAILL